MTMILTMLLGLFGCAKDTENTTASGPIVSVESMTLTLRGMRGSTVYKFEGEPDQTVLCRYREIYSGEETKLELEKRTECSLQAMTALMNACDVHHWSGFHGAHPKNVQDGIMFRFDAAVNGGQVISADGSANFPKGYHEFVRALDEMLAENEDESATE